MFKYFISEGFLCVYRISNEIKMTNLGGGGGGCLFKRRRMTPFGPNGNHHSQKRPDFPLPKILKHNL